MPKSVRSLACGLLLAVCGCGEKRAWDGTEVVFVIESNPTNLDARYGQDAQSQRIAALIYSGLVERDAEMNLRGDLAESWETPDALTYVFRLKKGVKFHDGREVTSKDVKTTIDYMMNPVNKSPKSGSFRMIASIEAPDAYTVVFHLKEPYASFLWNLEKSAAGIVPEDAGGDFAKHPIGSGPFRFVSQTQDEAVTLERWTGNGYREGDSRKVRSLAALGREKPLAERAPSEGGPYNIGPKIRRVTFRIVPDAIVRALELRKGSADIEVSSLSADLIPVLARQPRLQLTEKTGTNFAYLGMNLEDPVLANREVRQALAYATDRESLVKYLLRGEARQGTCRPMDTTRRRQRDCWMPQDVSAGRMERDSASR